MISRKKIFSFLVLSGIIFSSSLKAQEQEKNNKLFTLGSVNIIAGIQMNHNAGLLQNDFLNRTAAKDHLISLEQGYNWNSGSSGSFNKSILFGLHPHSEKKQAYNLNRELNLGVSFNHQISNAGSLMQTTLGEDTTAFSGNIYITKIDYLGISCAFIFKTDPEERFNVFIGYGINTGFSYDSELSRQSWQDTMFNKPGALGYLNNSARYSPSEDYSIKNSFYVQAYIPYGLSMRLAKTKPILKNISLIAEGGTGIIYQQFGSEKGQVSRLFNLSLGIRYGLVLS